MLQTAFYFALYKSCYFLCLKFHTCYARLSICPYVTTMPAKSLGTRAMIYAILEPQNPLPRKTMLWKGDMNVSASTSDTFLQR